MKVSTQVQVRLFLAVLMVSVMVQAQSAIAETDASTQQVQAQKPNKARRQRQMDVFIGLCAGQKLAAAGVEAPIPNYGEKLEAPADDIKAAVKAAIDECYTQITGQAKNAAAAVPTAPVSADASVPAQP